MSVPGHRKTPADPTTSPTLTEPPARVLAPLYAAGFTTAFGAHSIAAGLGAESGGIGLGLLTFGVLLALYDVAEVILKPVFGSLSDRIGAKPVIIAGLLGFALASLLGTLGTGPLILGLARLGQGAAASAFSPASSAAVARLAGPASPGSYFGKYGSWKGLGYVLGPLLGAGLIWIGGFPALFLAMAIISAAAALWVGISMPALPILPRARYTISDLVRQSTQRSFLIPTMALAGATGALGVAVGFLPLLGTEFHLPLIASMAVVAVLALSSTLTQPLVGRWRDQGRLTARAGMSWGLALIAAGIILLAVFPHPMTLYLAALVIGAGIGITTPLGFAHLAATTPPERMGRTMGTAEIGRELGDAAGPLVVGAIATTASLAAGLGALALLIAIASVLSALLLPRTSESLSTHQKIETSAPSKPNA
ncbi:MFS transporter [Arthrobacter livingstonensis]|uniref:MFS transporter n=1 Tax=Arthrobacter livingstonensis TaxID=670078 RepID=A0A2V5LDJ9_9MICC|nr:MFS transporter [Arthrobacter livingstonensis]PYI69811.1 MFS transporter [Arthrobacter livingstonensis]